MKKFLPLIYLIFMAPLVLWPGASCLAAETGLYTGEVAVADQSSAARSRAMPLALEQVLQKLSGVRDLEAFPEVEAALQSAPSMAITFYYQNRRKTLPDGSKAAELRLLVNFSKPAVDGLLQSLQLPLWKPERRPLTVWLIVDDGQSRRILPIEFEYAWEDIESVASARGLALSRPQADPDGNYAVDEQLLWGGYTEELVETGPVDALVMAALREGPEWNVRMNLAHSGKVWTWRARNVDIQAALTEGMQTAIDEIAAVNSIAAADQGRGHIEISIGGVLNSRDYIRLLEYLQGLSLVEDIEVLSAAPGTVTFGLTLNALPDYLQRTLESDGFLAVTPVAGEYNLLP